MNNFLDTLKKLGPARLSLMGAVLLGLLMFFVFVSMRVSTPELKMLYNDLSTEDSSAVAAKLEELKIPFEISNDATKVMVGSKDVGRARMLLAQEGLPNGGSLGYEIFDKQSNFGTTNFVQNINQVRALEGELARTIGSLDNVKSARVHLVLPQRELFSRENRPASASVFLQLKGTRALDQDQIAGIQSLIASAVPNLRSKDVSIVDSHGVLLARGGEDDASMMSNKADQMRRDYERRMSETIESLVGRTVGLGKVRATVTADLNFDRMTQNEEIFDPASQVVRSTQTAEEAASETEAGSDNVSVENNLPGAAIGGAAGGPTSDSSRTEETTNYEISKTTRNLVRETGEVKKLSVAVMLDGTYVTNDKGEKTYQPRSKEDIDRITALIKSAIGFDTQRGDTIEVANLQFADIDVVPEDDGSKMFGFERSDIIDAVEVLTVAVMIVLVVLLVLQPMVGRLLASEGNPGRDDDNANTDQALLPGMPSQAALAGPGMGGYSGYESPDLPEEDSMIDVQKVEGRVKASSLKKVEDIIAAYPEETVSVLRNWMTSES
ncbi:MAG: flagellar M-ring protein FliF [Micavibrio aeruginosavorus]|uniref:Flagellar M-ring protein n=1 Tax=Micavibrio aeruginosavorus TaxID=349221 RepID=A0A2W5FM56_9BACT|nr:MAG: flagellar M-ring protein FliF [Micavibrio aeruginosavorus]